MQTLLEPPQFAVGDVEEVTRAAGRVEHDVVEQSFWAATASAWFVRFSIRSRQGSTIVGRTTFWMSASCV